jgi:hypothetical protein
MSKHRLIVAQLTFAAALFIVSPSTDAHAQSCGNGNVQPSQGELCDNGGANNTQAIGCCAAGCTAFVNAGTTCRADAGICDNGAETCSGSSGTCPADAFATTATVCRASATVCDAQESCTGSSGACPNDIVADTDTLCRVSLGVCDPAETCDGTTTACPADAKSSSVCRPDSGQCDNGAETCDGTNNACPADSAASAGILCRASQGVCDPQEVCNGTASTCPEDVLSTLVCRGSSSACDAAEECDGTNADCPDNEVSEEGTVCRNSEGSCDPAEVCNGTSGACPANDLADEGTLCRVDSGACDLAAEFCDGTSTDCPDDEAASEGTLCRGSLGICDEAEECDGTNSTCPDDDKRTSVCRGSAGECDVAESCDGTSNFCPEDEKSDEVCRPVANPVCDVAESCDGTSDACPDDELVNCDDDDNETCTEAICDPVEGCILGDACTEICRGPGFWATHSGEEKGENIGQAVLDETGPIEVCGQVIDNTDDLGDLGAALEGLCVRTQGVKERQLYRTLIATAFNCAISEGGSCEDITDDFVDVSYEECNALCAGDDVGEDGPTLEECKRELGCFNVGGRIVDGKCARGTCEADSEELCGGDFADCPLIGDEEQDCIDFEDSCADVPLCSEDLDAEAMICVKSGPASSPKTCREARHNDCTIDDCAPDND